MPETNKNTLAKVSVAIDGYIETYHLDALALRCWNEMEQVLRICPCVLLSELNDRGIAASCEIDMCSAITMRAMSLASEQPTAVLDWTTTTARRKTRSSSSTAVRWPVPDDRQRDRYQPQDV